MASNGKKKTTFAKMNRESAVRERRQLKEARRAARKLEESTPEEPMAAVRPVAVTDEELAAALARP